MGTTAQSEADDERFFHFAVPGTVESGGLSIAAISAELKGAWADKALVTFRYPDRTATGESTVRIVEPYRVLLRSGVFYLSRTIARVRAWRTFALDRFVSAPVRAGSNNSARRMPDAYASVDVLGFIKSDQPRTEVTVELSRFVALPQLADNGKRRSALSLWGRVVRGSCSRLATLARSHVGLSDSVAAQRSWRPLRQCT